MVVRPAVALPTGPTSIAYLVPVGPESRTQGSGGSGWLSSRYDCNQEQAMTFYGDHAPSSTIPRRPKRVEPRFSIVP